MPGIKSICSVSGIRSAAVRLKSTGWAKPIQNPASVAVTMPASAPPPPSFGEFVHLLRRREGLSVYQFAEAVDIELSDAQAIEEDPFYRVDARTVWAIARTYHLPQSRLNEMAGIVVANDLEPFIDQQRYAARSELCSALSPDEIALLNIVVSVIEERAQG